MHRLTLEDLQEHDKLDETLVAYGDSCYAARPDRPLRFKFAILGVQNSVRGARGRMQLAWEAMKAWEHERPFAKRIPITEALMEVLFCTAIALR